MRLEQQVKLLVLLSLFSIGICVAPLCMASERKDDKSPTGHRYGEVEEDKSKELLEQVEIVATLPGLDAFDVFPKNSMDCLLKKMATVPKQIACRSESSRAPPAFRR